MNHGGGKWNRRFDRIVILRHDDSILTHNLDDLIRVVSAQFEVFLDTRQRRFFELSDGVHSTEIARVECKGGNTQDSNEEHWKRELRRKVSMKQIVHQDFGKLAT